MTTQLCAECRNEFPVGVAERKYRITRALREAGNDHLYCSRRCARRAQARIKKAQPSELETLRTAVRGYLNATTALEQHSALKRLRELVSDGVL